MRVMKKNTKAWSVKMRLALLALAAEGETVMEGMEYVRRGYEDIKGDLKSLGIVIY